MKRNLISLLLFTAFLIACSSSTYLIKSWTDPSVSAGTHQSFKKILAVARLKNPEYNKLAEDKMIQQFQGNVIPSYSYLMPGDSVQALVEEKLKKDGFDAVVIMKLMDINKTPSHLTGFSYGGLFGGEYGSPESWPVDVTYLVELVFYSVNNGKPLWSGTTSTMNPKKFEKSLDDIIAEAKAGLKKSGLTGH